MELLPDNLPSLGTRQNGCGIVSQLLHFMEQTMLSALEEKHRYLFRREERRAWDNVFPML